MRTPWWMNTETWTTRAGEEIALEDMSDSHRENTLNYIGRRMPKFRHDISLWWAVEVGMHDGGEAAHDSLERELHFAMEAPLEELMDSLPLVRRLRELNNIPLDPEPEPEVTDARALWRLDVALGFTDLGYEEWLTTDSEGATR